MAKEHMTARLSKEALKDLDWLMRNTNRSKANALEEAVGFYRFVMMDRSEDYFRLRTDMVKEKEDGLRDRPVAGD
jgi:predicted DNA-binding protein